MTKCNVLLRHSTACRVAAERWVEQKLRRVLPYLQGSLEGGREGAPDRQGGSGTTGERGRHVGREPTREGSSDGGRHGEAAPDRQGGSDTTGSGALVHPPVRATGPLSAALAAPTILASHSVVSVSRVGTVCFRAWNTDFWAKQG